MTPTAALNDAITLLIAYSAEITTAQVNPSTGHVADADARHDIARIGDTVSGLRALMYALAAPAQAAAPLTADDINTLFHAITSRIVYDESPEQMFEVIVRAVESEQRKKQALAVPAPSEYDQAVAGRNFAAADIATWPAWMQAGAHFSTTQLAAPAQPDGLAEFLQFRAEFRAWRDAQSAAPAQPNTWREAVLDALASTGGDMPATATPAEIVRAVIDAHVQIALDPRVSDAAPAQQPDEPMPEYLRDMITGMSVSVDVSTGEHDAGHRYFGTVTEVMDDSHDKFGVTLLVQDAEPNFKAPSVGAPAGDVRYQCRSRQIGESRFWGDWVACSPDEAAEYLRTPVVGDIEYGVQTLPAAQEGQKS